jgi:Ulp1 family protease
MKQQQATAALTFSVFQNHWCLAVVDFDSQEIKYYDSLSGQADDQLFQVFWHLVRVTMSHSSVVAEFSAVPERRI